jgi:hypothetical protein
LNQFGQNGSQIPYHNKSMQYQGIFQVPMDVNKTQNFYSAINNTLVAQAALSMAAHPFQQLQSESFTRESSSVQISGGKRVKGIMAKDSK